jgi:hypothetical protein
MLKTLRFVGVACAAVVCGLTLTHVLEIPGKRALSGDEWLNVQHTFYGGFAVTGGAAEVLGLVSTSVTAWYLRNRRFAGTLNLVGALCFLGMLLSFAFGNQPINAQIAVWNASTLPPNWPDYRDRWDAAHGLSGVFAAVALLALLGDVIRDTGPRHRTTLPIGGAVRG